MRKKKKDSKGLLFRLLIAGVITFSVITIYNHDSATATNEYSPATSFEDLEKRFGDEENNEFQEYKFEENIASKYSIEIEGRASYYADKFHDRRTANGEKFDMHDYTAAHKTLPFGTILRVTNLKNNKKTFVRINDRGPYSGSRVIDLSKKAAKSLGHLGLYHVKLEGFSRGLKKFRNSGKDYYFGFSYDNDLLCLSRDSYDFLDSASQFGDIVRMYNLAIKNDKSVLILVDASEKSKMEFEQSDVKYYLGRLSQNVIYEDNLASK
jgi:rare lipoprotein A